MSTIKSDKIKDCFNSFVIVMASENEIYFFNASKNVVLKKRVKFKTVTKK